MVLQVGQLKLAPKYWVLCCLSQRAPLGCLFTFGNAHWSFPPCAPRHNTSAWAQTSGIETLQKVMFNRQVYQTIFYNTRNMRWLCMYVFEISPRFLRSRTWQVSLSNSPPGFVTEILSYAGSYHFSSLLEPVTNPRPFSLLCDVPGARWAAPASSSLVFFSRSVMSTRKRLSLYV